MQHYANVVLPNDRPLAWEHIDCGVERTSLVSEFARAMGEEGG